MRQKQKMANANNRKRVINVLKSESKARAEKMNKAGADAKNSNVYHNVSGSFVQGSSHNPELGGSFGVILDKNKNLEIRKGGSLFSISYTRDERFKKYTEVYDKLNNDLKEEIEKKQKEEPKVNEDARNIKKDGIYIEKDEVLIDIKKIYEFPEPPKPPTPKSFYSRKIGLMNHDNKNGSMTDDYKSTFMNSDTKFSDMTSLKTTNTFLSTDFTKFDDKLNNKQPPPMDPEMLRLLRENQIKLDIDQPDEQGDPGIYSVPSFPNQLIHPESDIQKRIEEMKSESEAKVCVDDINRIREELDHPNQGIPCAETLAEIAELDILSLNKLFHIPEFLQVRKTPREQSLITHFNPPNKTQPSKSPENPPDLAKEAEIKEEGKTSETSQKESKGNDEKSNTQDSKELGIKPIENIDLPKENGNSNEEKIAKAQEDSHANGEIQAK